MAPASTASASTASMSPQAHAGTAMSGNQPQQPGPMMPTQAPPAGVPQSVVEQTAREYAGATSQPMQRPGGPAMPQQTSSVQTRLPLGGTTKRSTTCSTINGGCSTTDESITIGAQHCKSDDPCTSKCTNGTKHNRWS